MTKVMCVELEFLMRLHSLLTSSADPLSSIHWFLIRAGEDECQPVDSIVSRRIAMVCFITAGQKLEIKSFREKRRDFPRHRLICLNQVLYPAPIIQQPDTQNERERREIFVVYGQKGSRFHRIERARDTDDSVAGKKQKTTSTTIRELRPIDGYPSDCARTITDTMNTS